MTDKNDEIDRPCIHCRRRWAPGSTLGALGAAEAQPPAGGPPRCGGRPHGPVTRHSTCINNIPANLSARIPMFTPAEVTEKY